MTERLTPEQEASRAGWKYRCIQATKAGNTKLGTILCCVLGFPPPSPPWFGPSCVITAEGVVLANFVDRHNVNRGPSQVCTIDELVSNFRGLADHLALDDADREALFSELRKWVAVDHRADPDWKALRDQARGDQHGVAPGTTH